MKKVAAITIGQTPRDDVAGELEKVLGPKLRVVQAGALDGLSRAEIDALSPAADHDALVTRLRDGSDVIVGKSRIVPRLQRCLDRVAGETEAATILCAGVFPPFQSPHPVVMPERCMSAMVDAVFDGRRLGVIVPIVEQVESYRARWSRVDPRVAVVVASPYDDPARLVDAAEALRRAEASLVVMECMGFTSGMKQIVRDVTGVPALLPATVLAAVLAELV
jgi:protein AroM